MIKEYRHTLGPIAMALILVMLLVACVPAAPAATPTPAGKAPAAAALTPTQAPPKVAAPTPTAVPKEPYKIGLVASVSGYMAPMGVPAKEMVTMMEEKVNKEGGINGRPIKVIIYDDESDETKAVLAAKKLIDEDKVMGFLGGLSTGIAMATAPIVEEAKIPFVTMNSSSAVLSPPKKWVFKQPLGEELIAKSIYKTMKGMGIQRFALLTQGAGFGRAARKYFEDTVAQTGFTIVAKEEYGPTDTDMKPQLTKIKATDAQILVIYGAEAAGAISVRQSKEIGLKIPVLAPPSITMPAILNVKELRDGLEGLLLVGFKPDVWERLPDTDLQKKANAELARLVKEKYNRSISTWDGQPYDVFMVMIESLKRSNPDPSNVVEARAKIRDALETLKDFVGALSIFTYTAQQHEIIRDDAMVPTKIEGGKFVLVK